MIDALRSHASAEKAVTTVRAGEAEALMKDSLHTEELVPEVGCKHTGIRTERRVSHVFIRVPGHPKPPINTDAAANIFPTREDKADIARNDSRIRETARGSGR